MYLIELLVHYTSTDILYSVLAILISLTSFLSAIAIPPQFASIFVFYRSYSIQSYALYYGIAILCTALCVSVKHIQSGKS